MKWTFFFGCLLILSISLCGCVGSPYGPCGPYGGSQYGMYGGGCYVDECDPCGTSCPPMSYAYGSCGLPGAPVRTVGYGAAHVAATPVSWLVQILRGTNYPCHGCGDELYWGDYGYVPDDFCNPCTYDGQWAGGSGGPCGTVCQQGLAYQYPAVGSYMNQMYAPVFQDKIASTHARTPLNYGLRGPFGGACYDPCGYDPCGYDPCYTDSCSTGMCCDTGCDTGYVSGYGGRVSPGYAPPRQQVCLHGTGTTCNTCSNGNGNGNGHGNHIVSNVSQAGYRTAKPSSSVIANKVYPPVRR